MNYIDIHTHKKGSHVSIINIDKRLTEIPEYFFSTGLHPWQIDNTNLQEYLAYIKNIATHENLIAIGECGIDRVCDIEIKLQKEVFLKQIEIANDHNLPLIIHCVKAYSDIMELLKKKRNTTPWIFHGFNSNIKTAEYLTNNNCYLSFGEQLLKSKKLQDVFKDIPLSNIFFETDTSEVDISYIYYFAAGLKQISVMHLCNTIEENYTKVFHPSDF